MKSLALGTHYPGVPALALRIAPMAVNDGLWRLAVYWGY